MGIKCPGKNLHKLLDGLDADKFKELKATSNYGLHEIKGRLKQGFPNYSSGILDRLAEAANVEYIHNRKLFLALKSYGERIIDISDVLRKHVKECRSKPGSCHDNYLLWLESKGRDIMNTKRDSEESLPGIINDLDLKTLDLFVS